MMEVRSENFSCTKTLHDEFTEISFENFIPMHEMSFFLPWLHSKIDVHPLRTVGLLSAFENKSVFHPRMTESFLFSPSHLTRAPWRTGVLDLSESFFIFGRSRSQYRRFPRIHWHC